MSAYMGRLQSHEDQYCMLVVCVVCELVRGTESATSFVPHRPLCTSHGFVQIHEPFKTRNLKAGTYMLNGSRPASLRWMVYGVTASTV